MKMILRMDSKRRLSLPVTLVPWMPGDYVEVTSIEGEDAFVAQRIKSKNNALKLLKKAQSNGGDSSKPRHKKPKEKK